MAQNYVSTDKTRTYPHCVYVLHIYVRTRAEGEGEEAIPEGVVCLYVAGDALAPVCVWVVGFGWTGGGEGRRGVCV